MTDLSRRCYVLWVAPDVIWRLLTAWRSPGLISLPVLQECRDERGSLVPIPPDVRVSEPTASWERRAIGLRLQHESFPETPDGEQFPCLYAPCFVFQLNHQDMDNVLPDVRIDP